MRYIIKGSYPEYTITGYRGDEMVCLAHAADMRQVMLLFVHRLQPGDSIQWLDPVPAGLETSPAAWWAETDGATPQ